MTLSFSRHSYVEFVFDHHLLDLEDRHHPDSLLPGLALFSPRPHGPDREGEHISLLCCAPRSHHEQIRSRLREDLRRQRDQQQLRRATEDRYCGAVDFHHWRIAEISTRNE